MKITSFLSQHRNDFTASIECEHCGRPAKLMTGYHDTHYHERVLPSMRCGGCGKNRAGEVEHTDPGVSPCVA